MLHRNMAVYVHKSPDNMARMLLAYFSGMVVSENDYRHTLCCICNVMCVRSFLFATAIVVALCFSNWCAPSTGR